jgi:ketosteroid isomerase-like protein
VTLEEKAEIARRFLGKLARREIASAVECFEADGEFDFTRSRGPGGGVFVGRGEVQRNYEDVLEMWAEWVVEPHDFVDVGDDGLLFSVRGRMTGRDGIALTVRAAHIWTFRDGLIAQATFFQTREDALRAAGIT